MGRADIALTITETGLLELRARLLGQRTSVAFERVCRAFERRYSEDQPRVPAGEPGAGQWMEGDGGDDSPDASIIPIGGFNPGDENRSVQEFMSANCLAKIGRKMPGEFLQMTIGEVQALAGQGNAAANRCMKLLKQDRFKK